MTEVTGQPSRRGLAAAVVGGGVSLALVIALPELAFPFGRDQGVFCYVGSALLRGAALYRDVWEIKAPAIYWTYALIQRCLGGSELAVHAADLAATALSAGLLSLLALRFATPAAAVAAAGWYAALAVRGTYWNLAQAESFANPAVIAAALLLAAPLAAGPDRARPLPAAGRFFMAGICLGAALAYKVTLAPEAAVLLAWGWVRTFRGGGSRALPAAAAALAGGLGVALPVAASVGWMAAAGCLGDYVAIQRGFVQAYSAMDVAGPNGTALQSLWEFTRTRAVPLALAALAIGMARRGPTRPLVGLSLAWLLGGALGLAAQRKFFGYHWIPLLPPLALLAAVGTAGLVAALVAAVRRGRPVPVAAGGEPLRAGLASAVVLAWIVTAQWGVYLDTGRLLAGRLPREEYEARFSRPGRGRDYSPAATSAAARYLAACTPLGSAVYVWGFEPMLYVQAARWPPTRFFFNQPFIVPGTPPEWRRELMADLGRRPPEIVVVMRNDAMPWATASHLDSEAEANRFPALRLWLEQNYRLEAVLEDFVFYRRTRN